MNSSTNNDLFFKIYYTIRNNSVVIINDKKINNLYNYNTKQELQYDFMKINVNEILALCNLDIYNKILNTQYLNNGHEHLSKNGVIKTLERKTIDKLFILETLNDYRTIFSNIIGYDISIAPTHMTLKEFVGLEIITIFSEKIMSFFKELEDTLHVKINQKEIIYTISVITNIFNDLDALIRKRLNEDMIKYSFSEDNTFDAKFIKTKFKPTKNDYLTDIQTVKTVPTFYNFLQKMYPEATKYLEKIAHSDIFINPESQIHVTPTTCVADLKFSEKQTILQFKDLFINNVLINFYRNPKLHSLNVIITVHESTFQLQNSKTAPSEIVYVYGFTVAHQTNSKPLSAEILKELVSSPVPNLKLIFRELNL